MQQELWVKSQSILVGMEFRSGFLVIRNGKIYSIESPNTQPQGEILDFGARLVLPGIVDTHAHINEPGRTEWEGFETATLAAAAGGTTTVVDMPLNSIPATTTLQALKLKQEAARNRCRMDYGFWGGIVPENAGNESELTQMVRAGVLGFKCFLIQSGVDEFKMCTRQDLEKAMPILRRLGVPLLVHAELESLVSPSKHTPSDYLSYLESRPQTWEVDAIHMMIELCKKTECRVHIVHLSAGKALPHIERAKAVGLPFTVETCPHYLTLTSEAIETGATHFKCAPPIREKSNSEALWKGLKSSTIDLVVSDHSPCTPELKRLETGDFEKAWGGIAGLQFNFSLMASEARRRDIEIQDLLQWMSARTAQFAGLTQKGDLTPGKDADFIVYDPSQMTPVTSSRIHHRHKLTPYLGKEIHGRVDATFVRGTCVYAHESQMLTVVKNFGENQCNPSLT